MRVLYREGMALVLAEVLKITCTGSMLVCQLASTTEEGKPELLLRPLPSPELCEQFFREVICTTPADGLISLENTGFSPRLGAMLSEFDALFED